MALKSVLTTAKCLILPWVQKDSVGDVISELSRIWLISGQRLVKKIPLWYEAKFVVVEAVVKFWCCTCKFSCVASCNCTMFLFCFEISAWIANGRYNVALILICNIHPPNTSKVPLKAYVFTSVFIKKGKHKLPAAVPVKKRKK